MGSATNTATVTVNNVRGSRHGDYYRVEVAVNNQAGPMYAGMTNVGVLNNGRGNQ
jgi:hypothetical protein